MVNNCSFRITSMTRLCEADSNVIVGPIVGDTSPGFDRRKVVKKNPFSIARPVMGAGCSYRM